MPRPTKWRRIEQMPAVNTFIPSKDYTAGFEANVLKLEELEAIRLKDIEGLDQDECASRMMVSRSTYQRIIYIARKKVADSLINGKAIYIRGGHFTRNICKAICLDCGNEWQEKYENLELIENGKHMCQKCGSNNIVYENNEVDQSGKGYCHRHGRNR